MRLVYKFNIDNNKQLFELCRISKNLYNQALYIVKHELETNNLWIGYSKLDKLMKETTNLEGDINYRLLKAQVAQQCLKQLDRNIKSYVKTVKDWSKNKGKYRGKPGFPKYKKELNKLVYPNQSCTIKDGYIILSKALKIRIPQYKKYGERLKAFQQVRIIPMYYGGFTVEIVYIDNTAKRGDLDYSKYSSLDLGIDNLVMMVLPDERPVLFNGRALKSKNQFFNKTISGLKSELGSKQKTSKRIRRLYNKRENQVKDLFHKLSRRIVNMLIDNGIGSIVVGYNKGWKDSITVGRRNNQTFVQIPYRQLIDYLKYKCEMCGIVILINEESYTSKCDGLALESVEKHEEYKGKRIKRGLYQSSTGKLINADVNGALNIMRKVIGDSELIVRIVNSGWLFRPLRLNIN